MSLTQKNNKHRIKYRKETKNVIKTYDLIKNKIKNKSLKVDHRKKTLINKNAKFKNYILLEKFEKEERERKRLIELENQPHRIYIFNLKFFKKYITEKNIPSYYFKILPEIETICEEIINYKCKLRDLKYFYLKFSNYKIEYAKNIVPDEFALPKKIDNESRVSIIYKKCIDRKVNPELRVICFNILNLLIKKTRLEILKNKINKILELILSKKMKKKIPKLINIILDKHINNIFKKLGDKHLKYLFLIVY